MTTQDRIAALAAQAELFAPFTGAFDAADLEALLIAEFGSVTALEEIATRGTLRCRISPLRVIVHVVSGNTPHAAFQSLLRGLLLGAHNLVKLPRAGLPAFEEALARLAPPLAALVETSTDLPDAWLESAEVLVIFGDDRTVRALAARAPATARLITHGERLSIGLVRSDPEEAARLAAIDICRFEQRGCLSIHAVYVHPDCPVAPREFAVLLADAMAEDAGKNPPVALDLSAAGAVTTLRETVRFLSASQPDTCQLWHSSGSTDWTVVFEVDPLLKPSCLHRTAYVKPWPAGNLEAALGPELRHLACLALHPWEPATAAALTSLRPSRICPMGETQHPPLTWHHDGLPPLASLVQWTDIG